LRLQKEQQLLLQQQQQQHLTDQVTFKSINQSNLPLTRISNSF
jgi:hypothetical protein